MATYITIDGIDLLVIPPIDTDYQPKIAEHDLTGQNGTYTVGLGNKGRLLEFEVYVKPANVQTILTLKEKNSVVKLVSRSLAGYNGQYQIKKFTSKEYKTRFNFTIELQEYTKFNVTTKKFSNWTVSSSTTSSSSTASKKDKASALYNALLKCPTLQYGSSNTKCVKILQRLLRLNGYYIKYKGANLIVDGKYLKYTRWAVRKFQKDNGLKVTGIVDAKTKAKFKGKIGTSVLDSITQLIKQVIK